MTPPDVPAEVMAAIEAYRHACHSNANGCPNGQWIEDERHAALVAAIAQAIEAARGEGVGKCWAIFDSGSGSRTCQEPKGHAGIHRA